MRDAHEDKATQQRKKTKPRKLGEAEVTDMKAPGDGQPKHSMDYMTMTSKDDESKAPGILVIVNQKDGGNFSYATTGKCIQAGWHWLEKR